MNVAEFTAEAEKLSRTGFLLRKIGSGDPVAYWHGIGDGKPCVSFKSGRQWLTVTIEGETGSVSISDRPLKSHVPLYAEQYISLPPADAVFLLGSEEVERFLDRYDWPRNEPLNGNFPGQAVHD
jgi:hypothetical protein